MTCVSGFFTRFPIREVTSTALFATLAAAAAQPLTILFLWGENCPNCDIAKRALLLNPTRFT